MDTENEFSKMVRFKECGLKVYFMIEEFINYHFKYFNKIDYFNEQFRFYFNFKKLNINAFYFD